MHKSNEDELVPVLAFVLWALAFSFVVVYFR